jgi:hypothetical protein
LEIRLDALTQLNEVTPAEIETLADRLMRVARKNAGPGGPESGDYLKVAGALSKSHLQPNHVREMAQKGIEVSEIEEKYFFYEWGSYLDKETAAELRFYNASRRLDGLAHLAEAYVKLKQADQAQMNACTHGRAATGSKVAGQAKKNIYKESYLDTSPPIGTQWDTLRTCSSGNSTRWDFMRAPASLHCALRREARAWNRKMNRNHVTINWQFTRKKARQKFGYDRNNITPSET